MRQSERLAGLIVRLRRERRLQVVLALLLAGLVLFCGFWLGQAAVYSGYGIDPARHRAQAVALEQARQQLEVLRRELDMAEVRRDVDREALEMVRRELARQNERIASLEEGVRFYRGLMAPGELSEGFSLRGLELVPRETAGRYAYRIVAQQEASEHHLLQGELYAEVRGSQGGEAKVLPLAELSPDLASRVVPLRFRYFQSIEGELQLPEGFQPEAVSVVATIKSPQAAEVSESYPWKLQRYFTRGLR